MEFLIDYLLLFAAGSALGWVLELFFRRFFSSKKWINPGFLSGPYLPIYGFGVVIMYFVSDTLPAWWMSVLVIGAAMTLIELIAGLFFIKFFKIRLWDYSNRRFNFKGVICPTFSVIWALLGAAFYFFVYPLLTNLLAFSANFLYFSFFVGIFYGVFFTDVYQSFHFATKIRAAVARAKTVIEYERLKIAIAHSMKAREEKKSFLFPFRSKSSLKENIEYYLEKFAAKHSKRKKKDEISPPPAEEMRAAADTITDTTKNIP